MKDEMIHISYEEATTPKDRSMVLMNKWWTVYEEGNISIYTRGEAPDSRGQYSTYTPQYNDNKQIATRRGKMKAVFIPIVYFVDKKITDSNW